MCMTQGIGVFQNTQKKTTHIILAETNKYLVLFAQHAGEEPLTSQTQVSDP